MVERDVVGDLVLKEDLSSAGLGVLYDSNPTVRFFYHFLYLPPPVVALKEGST